MKRGVYSGRKEYILGGSHIFVEKGVYSGRKEYILGGSHIFVEKGVYSGRERGVDAGAPTIYPGIISEGGIFSDFTPLVKKVVKEWLLQ